MWQVKKYFIFTRIFFFSIEINFYGVTRQLLSKTYFKQQLKLQKLIKIRVKKEKKY